jgi:hypothetical protein
VAWGLGAFGTGRPEAPTAQASERLAEAKPADMDQALLLIQTARDKFANVNDYQVTFLRDERIEGDLKENHMVLKVRHVPFSVYMEWLAPRSRQGRKSAYVEGENDGKMLVREPLAGRFAITVKLDPEESKKRKESRRTIKEAGYRNLVERYVKSWQREKQLGRTQVAIQDGELKVALGEREVKFPCTVVTTKHDPKDRNQFTFFRSRVYFHKETGQLVRLEGYDWPTRPGDEEGELNERYTYLDFKTNVGLTDADFRF